MSLLAFFAFRILDRGPVLRTLKMDVALSSAAAFAEDELLVLIGQIGDGAALRGPMDHMGPIRRCLIAEDHGAYGHLYDFRDSAAAMHLLPLPVLAVFRLDDRLVEKIGKIIDMAIR